MKHSVLFVSLFLALTVVISERAYAQSRTQPQTLVDTSAIFSKGDLAPAANFTGRVWVQ